MPSAEVMKGTKANSITVMYVDLDNDLASCGITTPIIGIEQAIEVAKQFALCKPRDTDVNALFRAIQIAKELSEKGYVTNIAIVAGLQSGNDYEKLMHLVSQLEYVKKALGDCDVIVVFDSVEDEKALPLISQRFRVLAIETVVVEQARSIETAYTVLSKIVKKVMHDKNYARIALGYPGFAMFVLVLLSLFHLVREAIYAILLFLSVLMMLKGFGLYDKIKNFSQQPIKIVSLALMVVLLSTTAYLMMSEVSTCLSRGVLLYQAIGIAIEKYSHIALIAFSIPFFVKMLRSLQSRDSAQALLNITLLVDIMLSYILVQNIALIIQGESGARGLAITNSIAVALAMAVLTSISEAIVRGQERKGGG